MNKEITCKKCGWSWEESESDAKDLYVCHKCGYDNTPINETKIFIKNKLRESLFDDIPDETIINAYSNKINQVRDNLLVKISQNPDYSFTLGARMKNNPVGQPNKCETNAYNFVKQQLSEGIKTYYPVGGFLFEGKDFWPTEHWWIYDSINNSCIEVTPLIGEKPRCYAGIINKKIQDEILQSNEVFDLRFFKGGNVFHTYFS